VDAQSRGRLGKVLLVMVGTWICLSAAVILLVVRTGFLEPGQLKTLAREGVQVDGTVIALTKDRGFDYGFTAGGQEYKGHGYGASTYRPGGPLKVGDILRLTYLPSNPAVNVDGSARMRSDSFEGGFTLAALFVGFMWSLQVGSVSYLWGWRR
jgi:hypothetical protein